MLKDYVLAVISLRALHLKKMNMNFMFKSINFQKLSYQFDLFFPALLLKKIACQTVFYMGKWVPAAYNHRKVSTA